VIGGEFLTSFFAELQSIPRQANSQSRECSPCSPSPADFLKILMRETFRSG
jgi:hypothetical protein